MKYWKRIDLEGNTTTVESYSHELDVEGAIEITKQEFETYIRSLAVPEIQFPRSTHVSILEAIVRTNRRPARIKRVWEGREEFFDCFVTKSVKDEYVAGDIRPGDYVLVHFDDIGEQIVTAKVFRSWP